MTDGYSRWKERGTEEEKGECGGLDSRGREEGLDSALCTFKGAWLSSPKSSHRGRCSP